MFGRAKENLFRDFLNLKHAIPSHDTFSTVFRMIDPDLPPEMPFVQM